MGLEQAIIHKKEHRKPYYDSRYFDATCRNHGSCSWCMLGRLHKSKVQEQSMKDKEKE